MKDLTTEIRRLILDIQCYEEELKQMKEGKDSDDIERVEDKLTALKREQISKLRIYLDYLGDVPPIRFVMQNEQPMSRVD